MKDCVSSSRYEQERADQLDNVVILRLTVEFQSEARVAVVDHAQWGTLSTAFRDAPTCTGTSRPNVYGLTLEVWFARSIRA